MFLLRDVAYKYIGHYIKKQGIAQKQYIVYIFTILLQWSGINILFL